MPTLSLALAWYACAPGTIVTVQPGAIDKTALDGEWYWRRTIEDVPFGTAATFSGAQDAMERIRWEIQEDLLLGYRSYPHVENDGALDSAPLLTFAITDQFDIRRSYDPVTGEEGNVVQENREAPWYERDYIRVDWSANLAETRFSFAGLPLSVVDWATTDDRDEDAPQFDDSDGDGQIDSLLLTQRVVAVPETRELPGYGDVPVCLFFGDAEYECGATEIGVMHSFLRVDTREPIAGRVHDDRHMETFGFFSTERLSWADGYGLVEPNRVRWANHHSLWEQTYRRSGNGDLLCRTEAGDEGPCSGFAVDEQPVPLEIPYAERVVRPVVYHAGPDFPADLLPIMEEVAAEWNEPLRDTVNGLRFWECLDQGGKAKDCDAVIDPELQVFLFCPNNPSLPSDPAACSTDHTGPEHRPDGIPDPVRVGDLRYNLAQVVANPLLSSPFGYGPSAADPYGATLELADGSFSLGAGEIVSGHAFVYEYVLDRVAHQVADLVQLLNGEISTEDFVAGEDVTDWVESITQGETSLVGRTQGLPDQWDRALVEQRLALISNGFAPLVSPYVTTTRPAPEDLDQFLEDTSDAVERSGAFGAGFAEVDARFDQLLASGFAALAWSPETIGSMGFDPGLSSSDPSLGGRTPFDLLDPGAAAERERWRVIAGQQAVDLDPGGAGADSGFVDSSLLGLARDYARRGLSYEEIVADVRTNSFREVMLHEIGHTLGLRHNFSGSFDALNFRPEYWALRLDGDAGPRHVDPLTEAEIDGQIESFSYSTIMDYPASRSSGWAGLGYYDEAAIKFGYGHLVEVFTGLPPEDVIEGLPSDLAVGYMSAYASSNVLPSVLLNYTSGEFLPLHYTQFPALVGDPTARADVPLDRLAATFEPPTGSFADALETTRSEGHVPAGAPAVPYRFCGDEYAIGMTCARFDQGADPYEVQAWLMERYWNDYVLTNFARERYGFGDAAAYVARLEDRTFEPLRVWQRYYALFHAIFDVPNDPYAQEYFAADEGWGGWTAATDTSFRFMTQVITRPEPGAHAMLTRPDGVELLVPGGSSDEVALVDGAYFESEWDFDSGYFWFERQSRIGTYWDRMTALYTLANTVPYDFLGYDTAADPRQYAIGYQDLYRDPLAMFLGRIMADDVSAIAPVREADGTLLWPDPLDPGAAWPPAGSELVDPATYWLLRFDADAFGLSLLNHGYDRTFLNHARIYVEGTGSAAEPAPGQATVSYLDPDSGRTFTAWSFPDPQGNELSASARMVRRALALDARCRDEQLDPADSAAACAERQRFTADLDLHLSMYEAFSAAVE